MASSETVTQHLDHEIRERIERYTDPLTRWVYRHNFDRRPMTQTEYDNDPAAEDQAARRLAQEANPDWRLSGTNATISSTNYNPGGGVLLQTAGAANDQVILTPRTDGANQGRGIENAQFNLFRESYMYLVFAISSVLNVRFLAGLRNAIGADPAATFNETSSLDHVMVALDAASSVSSSHFRLSARTLLGTGTAFNVAGGESIHRATQGQVYRLEILTGGVPSTQVGFGSTAPGTRAWLNGVLIAETPSLLQSQGDNNRLKPVVGIQQLGSDVASIRLEEIILSRAYGVPVND